jgi:hypothetical protein
MKRIHLFEWEDQSWFPKVWRDFGTDYLRFIAHKFSIYSPVIPIIKRGLHSSGNQRWVDCASGGGSGLVNLAKSLKADFPDLKVILTDYYPNIHAFEFTKKESDELFDYESQPVDIRNIPKHLRGSLRSVFGAFHHFKPKDAQKILQDAVDSNSPIVIFEPVARNFFSWFSMLLVIPNILIITPFIRPFRWQVLPFIYLIPVIPLFVIWDGCVSILRTYSEKELNSLIDKLDNKVKFKWEVGFVQGKPSKIYYLSGFPVKE